MKALEHDDIIVRRDVHGDEERLRVLWKVGEFKVRVKSLDHPHKDAFNIETRRIIRNEGRRNHSGALA